MTMCLSGLSLRVLAACAAAALVLMAGVRSGRAEDPAATPTAAAAPSEPLTPQRAAAVWQELTDRLGYKLAKCQWVLLGTRSPQGPSCVNIEWGHNKSFFTTGGPGTRIAATLMRGTASRTPSQDFTWNQTVLKASLERMQADNQEAFAEAVRLAGLAEELRRGISAWSALPQGFVSADIPERTNWVGYCVHELDDALQRRDLAACRKWAGELSAATFALADLHRWLDFLLSNHMAALAFQARCETLFTECDTLYDAYDPARDEPWFPAMQVTLRGLDNYYEVERQAEWLMRVPAEYLVRKPDGSADVKTDGLADVPAALWMPPDLRPAFVELRSHLSPANREIWDSAAHGPFDRSYLVNMLFRTSQAKTLDDAGVVLGRLSKLRPEATAPALMGSVFYRGGATIGSGQWGSRYDRRLMQVAADIEGDNEQVLLHAQRFTRALLGGPQNYGPVMSTREALDTRKIDCLAATDIVGSLFRNAGRTGFFCIRWCAGTAGHSVAAAEITRGGERAIVIADGLADPQTKAEQWPDAYFRGHTWPSGYVGKKPDVYAFELYTRGLDDYVWVEGYIARGPYAGLLTGTGIPYLPRHSKPRMAKVDVGQHGAGVGPKKG